MSDPAMLDQMRCRETSAIASRLGVPVRLYLPFGLGWWPYALGKALARSRLVAGSLKDAFALPA